MHMRMKWAICLLTVCLFIALLPAFAQPEGTACAILPGKVLTKGEGMVCTLKLEGLTEQEGWVIAEHHRVNGQAVESLSLPLSEECEVTFTAAEALDYAIFTWVDKAGERLCDPVTVQFDVIYATDWQTLAGAMSDMVKRFDGKIELDPENAAYASGRIIARIEGELPDISDYHPALTVIDDENHYYIQFLAATDARACAEYLMTFSNVEYAEPDGAISAS